MDGRKTYKNVRFLLLTFYFLRTKENPRVRRKKGKQNKILAAFLSFRGGRGIRTPGPLRVNGFQDRRVQPDSAIPPEAVYHI